MTFYWILLPNQMFRSQLDASNRVAERKKHKIVNCTYLGEKQLDQFEIFSMEIIHGGHQISLARSLSPHLFVPLYVCVIAACAIFFPISSRHEEKKVHLWLNALICLNYFCVTSGPNIATHPLDRIFLIKSHIWFDFFENRWYTWWSLIYPINIHAKNRRANIRNDH